MLDPVVCLGTTHRLARLTTPKPTGGRSGEPQGAVGRGPAAAWGMGYWKRMRGHLMRLSRFRQLPPEEQRLLPIVAVLLGLARLGVSHAGVPRTRCVAARLVPRSSLRPQRLADLVRVACQVLPGVTRCLSRSIVLEALLIEAGHAAELRIGLAPPIGPQRPDAHAWVELGGVAVAEDASRYTALSLFGTRG